MASNPQTQAIGVANQLIALAGQLMSINLQMQTLDAQWTDQNVANTLAAMKTAVLNADGSIGANDGAPNAAHPLDPVSYPGMSRALTSTQIAQIKTIMDGLVNYATGQAVATQIGARAILNAATGG